MTEKVQTIFRVMHDPENPYVIMDKRPLEKPYLSWKAKGLLAYLLSRPDDWKVRLGDLVKRSSDGGFATRQALRELQEAGHAKQVIVRSEDGRRIKEWVYEIYESPLLRGFQQVDYQQVENRARTNIESTNNKKTTKKEKRASKPPSPPPSEVSLFRSVTGKYPKKVNFEDVKAAILCVGKRLGRAVVEADLLPFYRSWCARNFNPGNLAWLTDWAVNDMIPQNGQRPKGSKAVERNADIHAAFAAKHGVPNG